MSNASKNAALLARAQILVDTGRFAEAVPLLRQAAQADPGSREARCLLAISLHVTGHSREGLQVARDAVLLDPDYEWPYRVQATILNDLRKRKEALRAAEEAVRLLPNCWHGLECLARVQHSNRQWKAANETAAHLLRLAPDWPCTHELLADFALAGRRFKDAERHYRDTLRLDPESHSAMNNLGVTLQRLHRHKEAIECFHQAARISPAEKISRDNLYDAVRGYAGLGFFGVWVLFQVIRVTFAAIDGLPEHQQAAAGIVSAVLIAAAVGVAWWLWRRRIRELHPTITAFYLDERRRTTRESVNRVGAAVLILAGLMITGLWSAGWATVGANQAGLTSWPLLIYLLIAGGTAGAIVHLIRKHWRDRKQRP